MKKLSRHISLVLLLFIAYPYVFQAFHILHHDHSHKAGNEHYHTCSSHDHNVNSSDIPDEPHRSSFPGSLVAGIPAESGHEHKHCPLCEHEFAKFSIKSLFHIYFKDERFSLVNVFLYNNPSVFYTGNHRSFRAPPPVI